MESAFQHDTSASRGQACEPRLLITIVSVRMPSLKLKTFHFVRHKMSEKMGPAICKPSNIQIG